MANLLKRLLARYAIFLMISGFILAGFEYLMCAIVSLINLPDILSNLPEQIPPVMRALIEQQFFGGFGPTGILAFGWNHPIALALGTAVSIVLASRACAGEIEEGTLELILSQPISRTTYLTAQIIFAFISLTWLSVIGVGGMYVGQCVYALHLLDAPTLLWLALNYLLLHAVWYSVTLLISILGREAGQVAFIGFLITLVSYLLQVIGQLWTPAAFLLPYSANTYYSPRTLLIEHALDPKSIAILSGISVVAIAVSLWRFHRRDIP